ncbi:hypothetical protein TNCV_4733261 [Trichonephila clavipes]|nr:hypothetical protein TNCV_4733261 [Trichonephila clavipes]
MCFASREAVSLFVAASLPEDDMILDRSRRGCGEERGAEQIQVQIFNSELKVYVIKEIYLRNWLDGQNNKKRNCQHGQRNKSILQ